MSILQEQHDRAVHQAIQLYEGKQTKFIYHEGKLIPDSLRERLLLLLHNIRWAVPNHLVLLSNVQNDVFYNELHLACKELMAFIATKDDPTVYYSGIAIT